MSEQHQEPDAARRDPAPGEPESGGEPAPATVEESPESTVGTGTSIALGCVAGTLLLIVIGIIFLLVVIFVS